jgi:hypothetical protein
VLVKLDVCICQYICQAYTIQISLYVCVRYAQSDQSQDYNIFIVYKLTYIAITVLETKEDVEKDQAKKPGKLTLKMSLH